MVLGVDAVGGGGGGVVVSSVFLFVFKMKSSNTFNISSLDLTPRNCKSLQNVTLFFVINSGSLISLSYSSSMLPLFSRSMSFSSPVKMVRTASCARIFSSDVRGEESSKMEVPSSVL